MALLGQVWDRITAPASRYQQGPGSSPAGVGSGGGQGQVSGGSPGSNTAHHQAAIGPTTADLTTRADQVSVWPGGAAAQSPVVPAGPYNTRGGDSLAAAEIGAMLLASVWSAAQVTGTDLLTPAIRDQAARALIEQGQAVLVVDQGHLCLVACQQVTGGRVPSTWRYLVTAPTPGPMSTVHELTHQQVAHVCWAVDPARPWQGLSPLATIEARAASELARVVHREAQGPHGYLLMADLPQQMQDTPDTIETVKQGLGQLLDRSRGSLVPIVSAAGTVIGQSESKRGEVTRVGVDPPTQLSVLHGSFHDKVLASMGISAALSHPQSSGGGREAWRRFIAVTAQPRADQLASELSRVLGGQVAINCAPSRSSDELAGRARAAASLVAAGWSQSDAASICDL